MLRPLGMALFVALLAPACGDDGGGGGPHINSLAPPEAMVGAAVEVLGQNFCGEAGPAEGGGCMTAVSGFVTFGVAPGLVRAGVMTWDETRITVTVPSGVTGPTSVVVTVDGVPSNTKDFEVLP